MSSPPPVKRVKLPSVTVHNVTPGFDLVFDFALVTKPDALLCDEVITERKEAEKKWWANEEEEERLTDQAIKDFLHKEAAAPPLVFTPFKTEEELEAEVQAAEDSMIALAEVAANQRIAQSFHACGERLSKMYEFPIDF